MNNTEQDPQLHILKEIKLSPIEKTEIRDSLLNFMAAHPPVQTSFIAKFFTQEKFIISPYAGISMHMGKVLVFSFLGLMITGGSLTMASANSIPGEILYPIKINIKEQVEGALKTQPAEKLAWKGKKVERRIQEIKELKEKKDISKSDVVIAQAILQEHVQDLKDTVATLKLDGNEGLILSNTAELIPVTETLNITITADEASTEITTTSETNNAEEIQVNPDAKPLVHTEAVTEILLPDISSLTENSNQTDLIAALSHEVDKQIIEIKKTVEVIAQDAEKAEIEIEQVKKEDLVPKVEENKPTLLPQKTDPATHQPVRQ